MTPVEAERAVAVMAKLPKPGDTKTRLVPPLTAAEAADLATAFLEDAADVARRAQATPFIATWPAGSSSEFAALVPGIGQVSQVGDRLNERLDHVLRTCLDDGFRHVVAINGDSPTLPPARIDQAFAALDGGAVDVVLGPADDGGYYLIGCSAPCSSIILDVEMSTPSVLDDTVAAATAAGLRVELLEPWFDVDDIADLTRLRAELTASAGGATATRAWFARSSVAIP